jgi:hypothetical protein
LVEGKFGRALDRRASVLVVEIPADLAPGIQWGLSGFIPVFTGARRHCRSSRRPHGWPRVFASLLRRQIDAVPIKRLRYLIALAADRDTDLTRAGHWT